MSGMRSRHVLMKIARIGNTKHTTIKMSITIRVHKITQIIPFPRNWQPTRSPFPNQQHCHWHNKQKHKSKQATMIFKWLLVVYMYWCCTAALLGCHVSLVSHLAHDRIIPALEHAIIKANCDYTFLPPSCQFSLCVHLVCKLPAVWPARSGCVRSLLLLG